jgi:hypothetical protein
MQSFDQLKRARRDGALAAGKLIDALGIGTCSRSMPEAAPVTIATLPVTLSAITAPSRGYTGAAHFLAIC